jgi:putative flippase GtrA
LLSNFVFNRRWTFQHSGPIARSFTLFLAVHAVAYILNLSLVLSLIDFNVNSYLAQVLGAPAYAALTYIGLRYLVFGTGRPGG